MSRLDRMIQKPAIRTPQPYSLIIGVTQRRDLPFGFCRSNYTSQPFTTSLLRVRSYAELSWRLTVQCHLKMGQYFISSLTILI